MRLAKTLIVRRCTSRSACIEVFGCFAQFAAVGVEQAMEEAGLDDMSMVLPDAWKNPGPLVAVAAGCDPGRARVVTNSVDVVVGEVGQEQQMQVPQGEWAQA